MIFHFVEDKSTKSDGLRQEGSRVRMLLPERVAYDDKKDGLA
jgi:hypothetical protein